MPYEIAPTTSFPTEEHVQEHLEGLLEDGHDQDEMKEFIETHGNSDFLAIMKIMLEWLTSTIKRQSTHFLQNLILWTLNISSDAYYGQYDSEQEFAENFVSECYGLPDMPYWIAIDWEKTWDDGLSWDYTFNNGYVFCNHW